ncbi:TraR/DksA family transcriptional regulator [Chitinolyticbacter meiyuanensis]|uniref:TraR/DksA family transcriptional regulator n=1 Tax=Chitinolyticbacter meiyuanensis TaxID=682798 RepID=UPI0011E5D743|nr:TraR/DksA family transcriptional regulator [Chitinolyticbacter meiyuanensis]
MDQYDRASELEQAEREAAIANARNATKLYRSDCIDCGDDLEPHRLEYGICVPCKATREHQDKQRGRR